MGNSYITLKGNGADDKTLQFAYNRLKTKRVKEASEMEYFERIFPPFSYVEDIEIGDETTNESIVRLKNRGFIAFYGKIKIDTIIKNLRRR